jgi:excisionase family DNA binding protein
MHIDLDPADIEKISGRVAEIVIGQLKVHLSQDKKEEPFLTVEELVQYIKVKKSWIYQRVHAGEIPYHKVGNQLRFRKSEIDADL